MSHNTSHGGASHGSVKSYITGFILSVVLTVIPFWIVMESALPPSTVILVIAAFAVAQILVQLIYFLHMDTKSEGGWNMIAFVFTVLIIAIIVVGSLWIMFHLNHNMMGH
ncbi:cytochrome o ubiquinol oxidase subunit IV [Tolumonas auensis DSM 9187]|jgi:cytochrome o ubiquinol oxidase operon protein cyoD|uniref:Cytochrome bo(3) ubiquinol oxidase subunit 4 n=1 Tax=Tolumonas auensis (strain DSM 9187 / NBRC 110442 / TA 4) TaxID=595494 RepID=C4L836_TOLAT|nr:cytochrome o ubiquinol oxidase subunit IV [Tolumonas auensis]ACQ93682.1 cytochrome o ubiquinol oxidase subunit IV [Tolumonas auensis DSM 9187]